MKIGDEVYVHGYIDEIRNDVIIIRNDGGYFGTFSSEVVDQEPCEDLISRQAAIDAVHSYFKDKLDGLPTEETEEGYEVVCDMDKIDAFLSDNKYLSKRIENLPSAQPFTEDQIQTMQELEFAQVEKAYELGKADRPTGHWIFRREFVEGTPFTGYRCSNCNYWQSMGSWNFCPNCGADMRGGEEE